MSFTQRSWWLACTMTSVLCVAQETKPAQEKQSRLKPKQPSKKRQPSPLSKSPNQSPRRKKQKLHPPSKSPQLLPLSPRPHPHKHQPERKLLRKAEASPNADRPTQCRIKSRSSQNTLKDSTGVRLVQPPWVAESPRSVCAQPITAPTGWRHRRLACSRPPTTVSSLSISSTKNQLHRSVMFVSLLQIQTSFGLVPVKTIA